MNRTIPIIFIFFVLIIYSCNNQQKTAEQEGEATTVKNTTIGDNPIIAFYNVENLFDTIDDPKIRDEEFLPNSEVTWNTERFTKKLDNISKVLAAIGDDNHPAIIGLSEVENTNMIFNLIKHPQLKNIKYSFVHMDSPDERGIDVALLFDPDFFLPIENHFISIKFPFDPDEKTRDVLYTKGLAGKDTLHIFVNHWPSRYGGREKSQPKRNYVAGVVKRKCDSIFAHSSDPYIILMGDFNDNPVDTSILHILNAKPLEEAARKDKLYNLSYNKFEEGEGSLYYKSWDMFDQIIVSSALLNKGSGIRVKSSTQYIFKPEWILYQPEEGPARPNRTKGRNYYGGYSDHLPVYIKLERNKMIM